MLTQDHVTPTHRGSAGAGKSFGVSPVSLRLGVSFLTIGIAVLSYTVATTAAGDPPLIEAAKARNVEAVRSLLKQRVDVNTRQPDNATALHWAVHLNDGAMVDVLLRAGAKADLADDTGATPIYLPASIATASWWTSSSRQAPMRTPPS